VSIGSKKVVLSKENGFKAREIKTGIELNDFIQVLEGLGVKEAIAAQYLMDSESFIKTE
jgi:Cu(I)/Ag(I) efflux system membrane fusion protein